MALTTAQQVRLRIQDPWRRGSEVQYGDSTASSFQLAQGAPYSTLISATASIVNNGWSATGCTVDNALGYVTFSGIPSANTAVRFDYQWAVFSDDAVDQFLTDGGSVRGAALQAVRTLRFNAPKRARWAAPDGTQYDDTQTMRALKELEDDLKEELVRYGDEGAAGGYESWAASQEEF